MVENENVKYKIVQWDKLPTALTNMCYHYREGAGGIPHVRTTGQNNPSLKEHLQILNQCWGSLPHPLLALLIHQFSVHILSLSLIHI